METSSFSLICDKIRTLCKECDITPLPHKFISTEFDSKTLSSYLNGLDGLRSKIFVLRSQEEEYRKLEECLQRNETEIRKHIGVFFIII